MNPIELTLICEPSAGVPLPSAPQAGQLALQLVDLRLGAPDVLQEPGRVAQIPRHVRPDLGTTEHGDCACTRDSVL